MTETTKRYLGEPVTALLGVALGVVVFLFTCLVLAVYVNRCHTNGDEQGTNQKEGPSCDKLKKLNAVSPIRKLDEWWLGVKDSLGLSGAVDSHFVCVICLEQVQRSEEIHELKCLHVFHKECLEKWYLRGHFACPLCHRAYFQEPRAAAPDFVWMV